MKHTKGAYSNTYDIRTDGHATGTAHHLSAEGSAHGRRHEAQVCVWCFSGSEVQGEETVVRRDGVL